MKNKIAAIALAALSAGAQAGIGVLEGTLQTGDGSQANAYDFGVLAAAPKTLMVTLSGQPASNFEEYADFSIDVPSAVSGAANTYTLSIGGWTVMDLDDLSIEVWNLSHPNGSTLYASFAGDNTTAFIGSLAPGNYHLDVSGKFAAPLGQYSVTLAAVPAVPEPQTYALMLAGLGAVAFVARRRRIER